MCFFTLGWKNRTKNLILNAKEGKMKILILGLGINGGGLSAARYFAGKAEVRISDIGPRSSFGTVPDELEALGITCFFADNHAKKSAV